MKSIRDQRRNQVVYFGAIPYFPFYNSERLHQSLDYRTPAAVYGARLVVARN
jgi:putative transposase